MILDGTRKMVARHRGHSGGHRDRVLGAFVVSRGRDVPVSFKNDVIMKVKAHAPNKVGHADPVLIYI